MPYQRAAECDALTLPAGQLSWLTIHELRQLQRLCRLLHSLRDIRVVMAAQLEPEAEIALDRHVRIQRVALEHHRDVAIAGLEPRDVALADQDRAGSGLLQPGDQPQQCALTAARWADQHQQFAVADSERGVVDRDMPVRVDLTYAAQRYFSHGVPLI